jgi:hypothetical protein
VDDMAVRKLVVGGWCRSWRAKASKQEEIFILIVRLKTDCCFALILTSLCGCESYPARDTMPLCSPSLQLTSPILAGLLVRTLPPHLYSPLLPGMCPSPIALLPRASTPGEEDSGEPERAPGIRTGSGIVHQCYYRGVLS